MDFVELATVPSPGEIVEAAGAWEEAAGGGAVAAVQLAKLAGTVTFYTALGDDDHARRARAQLEHQGVELAAAARPVPQRRAVAFLDSRGERTITVFGKRLVPAAADDLPWDRLAEMDGVYFTGGDVAALRAARAARTLVATPRARDALDGSGVMLDALVRSGADRREQEDSAQHGFSARFVCTTHGAEGGTYVDREGRTAAYKAAALDGPVVDAYGAGDSFAAGVTFGLGAGMPIEEALSLASRCGAGNLTGRGPYAGQPTAADLGLDRR